MKKILTVFVGASSPTFAARVQGALEAIDKRQHRVLQLVDQVHDADIVIVTPNDIRHYNDILLYCLSDNPQLIVEYPNIVELSPVPTSSTDIELIYVRLLAILRLIETGESS